MQILLSNTNKTQSGIPNAPHDYSNPNHSLSSDVQDNIKSILPNRILLRLLIHLTV